MVLSVHLITFNNEKHIEQTLSSIVNQKTSFDYEIVIGDDASTDKTVEVIKSFKKNSPKPIHFQQNQENLGMLHNFYQTLLRCKGDYVFDIAGDDWLHRTDALEIMVKNIKLDSDYSFIDSGYDVYYEKKDKTNRFYNKKLIHLDRREYLERCIIRGFPNIGCCYNRQKLMQYVDFKKYIELDFSHEDYPIFMDLIHNTNFGRINEALTTYRVHKNSFSYNFEGFLKVRRFFIDKYNLGDEVRKKVEQIHERKQLLLASIKGDSKKGKESFKRIQRKTPKIWAYFVMSQSNMLRFLLSFIREV